MPDLGFTWDRGSLADLLALKRVNNRTFTNVRVANETNTNVLLIFMEVVELENRILRLAKLKRIASIT